MSPCVGAVEMVQHGTSELSRIQVSPLVLICSTAKSFTGFHAPESAGLVLLGKWVYKV